MKRLLLALVVAAALVSVTVRRVLADIDAAIESAWT